MSIASRISSIKEHLEDAYDEIESKGANLHLLPSEYTQVDYIESSGTQYIDTGIYPYKTKTEITFQLLDNYSMQNANKMLGGLSENSRYILAYLYYAYSPQVITPANSSNGLLVNIPMDNNKHTLIYNDENNNIIYDNIQQSFISGKELTDLTSVATKSLTLFAANRSIVDLMSSYKLYNCKITNKNTNTLERDFIPCYRNSDNEVGLYDLVNNVFYTNQGTGVFTYGEVKEDYAFAKNISNLSRAINLIPTD